MLTEEQIEAIASEVSNSGAQKAAAMKALSVAVDQLVACQPAADQVIGQLTPQAPTVLCVATQNSLDPQQRAELFATLDRARDRFGRIEILTFGGSRSSGEANAIAWAQRNGFPHREFAAAWTTPLGGGLTQSNPNAARERNQALVAYLQQAKLPIVYTIGSDRRINDVRATAIRAGAYHTGRPVPAVFDLDVEPVVAEEVSADA